MIPAEHPPRSPTTTQEPHLQPGRVARPAATPWPATYNCPSFSGSHLTPRSERGLALPHTTFIGVTEHRRRPIGPARKAPWTAVRCVGSAGASVTEHSIGTQPGAGADDQRAVHIGGSAH